MPVDAGPLYPAARIERFSRILDAYPAAFGGNPLNLLLVEDAEPIQDARRFLQRLDSPFLVDERRTFLTDEEEPWPFPRIDVDDRPDPWLVSERLFARFDAAVRLLPTQDQIAERVEREVIRRRPNIVALMIVDGLSYYDLDRQDVEPCLVPGITTTEFGYRQVVGQPSLSRRLFALDYVQQRGFTYFDPEVNALSADLYRTFSPSQVVRVSDFGDVLATVREMPEARTYIQVSLAGLDQICHAHYDRPPLDYYKQRILSCFGQLVQCLRDKAPRVLVVLTADHGIMWRDDVEERLEIADDLLREDVRSPRYLRGSFLRAYGRTCRCLGQNYTLLRAPWMTRRFRNNEWGVHGGISAWESLVPFIVHSS